MEFRKEGEWTVSTPVYVGDSVSVEKAAKCGHQFRETEPKMKEIDPETGDPIEMVMEACTLCVARRAKYRKAVEVADGKNARRS